MNDPLWYKDAVIYEVRVRAFFDSDKDGIGDFRGLAQKLDYLQDLGVTALWLLPFYPSPLRDDGYDISNYTDVHPDCGTLADFKFFLKEAHRRGLRVITELVLNHTSDQHPWFQRARKSPPGSRFRDFYVWSDSPDRYKDARIIFKDFEHSNWAWDPVAQAYYWHRFYAHQPDLNFDNVDVQKAVMQALDFWLDLGVDGLRLDAIPYLFQREETYCENLPETHAFLKTLRRHVDRKYKDRMFLAEANQWPDDAVSYFGNGDECHMAFHFPIMPRLFMSLHMEDRTPIIDILDQTPPIPANCQWALFLRNHDELTLEMVTDEERDYMYRVYATDPQARVNLGIRRRLAPLLGNLRRKIELMNGLLFSLPGTPVIYYGDEIGMGDNIYLGDRNGVRTPMQWSADRNAGFSGANPQKLYLPVVIDPEYNYETVNVEAQTNNPHSLFWWMKRLIALRKRCKAFGQGTIEFLSPNNPKALAFIRRHEDEIILVVANLSRFVQYAELGLSQFKGMRPVELFGRVPFPAIGDLPYFITLGPHAFYWFVLEPVKGETETAAEEPRRLPTLTVTGDWTTLLSGRGRTLLEDALPAHLRGRRWFAGKARALKIVRVMATIPLPPNRTNSVLALLQAEYTDGNPDMYLLPLTTAVGERRRQIVEDFAATAVAMVNGEIRGKSYEAVLYDASAEPAFALDLLDLILRRRQLKAPSGLLRATPTRALQKMRIGSGDALQPAPVRGEQSNTSVILGEKLVIKMFRRLERGVNPDLEISRHLTERTAFRNLPALAGAVEFRGENQSSAVTLALAQEFIPNQGDAWRFTLDQLGRFYEHTLAEGAPPAEGLLPEGATSFAPDDVPEAVRNAIGTYLTSARQLGERTAELHNALASATEDPAFAPEAFTPFSRRALYQFLRGHASKTFTLLKKRQVAMAPEDRNLAHAVLAQEAAVLQSFEAIRHQRLTALQIRCHGDFHLGQVLYTGKDFVILDFEGEPARSFGERKLKRSPLRDVAGMLRSFHYAAHAALIEQMSQGAASTESLPVQEKWAAFWCRWVSASFLSAYMDAAEAGGFLPKTQKERELLLNTFLIEKAVYELAYEMNNRPDWVKIPLRGILDLAAGLG